MTARRLLFFAPGVSLAHVARPSLLAAAAQAAGTEVHFATDGHFALCHAGHDWVRHKIDCLPPGELLARLAAGSPLVREAELQHEVEQDLALMRTLRPDAVVGDFRLSLAIAARRAGIRWFSVCNAYWSPYARDRSPPPAPDVPARRLLGGRLFDPIFRQVWPLASRAHTAGMNAVRRRHGLAPYDTLQAMYCDGDDVLYADTPSLSPVDGAPPHHHYLGPLSWSPDIPLPPWWDAAMADPAPRAYITLGSTGNPDLLPSLLQACRTAGLRCLVATAGRAPVPTDAPHCYGAEYLPGHLAAAAADLVVCNGGSPTSHQALAQGRPVLGVCANLDQMLNMRQIAAAGAGAWLRSAAAPAPALARALAQVMSSRARQAAQGLKTEFDRYPASVNFSRLITLI